MARFPTRESEIRALAQSIIAGLNGNPDFPNPPVSSSDLQAIFNSYTALEDAQVAAQAAAQKATEAKQVSLDELVSLMKKDLSYAENAVDGNDAKLAALGWSGKAQPTPLQAPGQPRSLDAVRQSAGLITLAWKKSPDGGKPSFYQAERRELPRGEWTIAGTSIETEIILSSQERGKEFEYRIVAVNKAGASDPSNTVTAIL